MTTLQLKRQMCRRPERISLAMGLNLLGVRKNKTRAVRGFDVWQLTDFYRLAKRAWLKLYRKYRPDLGHNHEVGIWLNALWAHVKKLFRRRGVET